MDKYEKAETVGEGTFGVVSRATRRSDGKEVALKKIKLSRYGEGVHFVGLREVRLMQELSHPNVMPLLDVFAHKQHVYLVIPFLQTDLEVVVKDRAAAVLQEAHIKCVMRMLLEGMSYLHKNWVLHRDLKPGNLLFASDGTLLISDFGLARTYGTTHKRMTSEVVTRWYRAPELLFGATLYGPAVDMWAVGCIFAEMMRRDPLLPGNSDIDQLGKIFHCFGTPTEETWPGVTSLPAYIEFEEVKSTPLSSLFPAASPEALDLLSSFFCYNPKKRISAKNALQHAYFRTGTPPCVPSELPLPAGMEIAQPSASTDPRAVRRQDMGDTRRLLF